MARRFCIAFIVLLLFGYSGWAQAQAVPVKTESAADNMAEISLGQSAVPLYGPWKFTIGDSPLDPGTHAPLWACPSRGLCFRGWLSRANTALPAR
jgi:hypothetical protein